MIRSALAQRFILSPNVGARRGRELPDMVVLHYTGMADAEAACAWLCDPRSQVSCHYLVDLNGAIIQMVDEELRAWHAGVSSWEGDEDINSRSVGIEIHNPGHVLGYSDFPAPQMEAVARLAQDICQRHAILPRRVLAHSDVAPGRKVDPGEKFDWRWLHGRGVGAWAEAGKAEDGRTLVEGDAGPEVDDFQAMLRRYGYGIDVTGSYDSRTKIMVEAFQRHFRPARIDGRGDASTIAILRKLVAAV
ncbi:MAG: N-acetylmuramoyl-L-alanine amidase [Alphaproteobacteria bacterium]|nr:N-acetylmuramoyl-L-alanine amidase [Alphaproteobacteria bacterium]